MDKSISKIKYIICITLLALGFNSLADRTDMVDGVKVFKDWAVSCNNINSCEAVSFTEAEYDNKNSNDMSASAYLSRKGGKDSKLIIRIDLGEDDILKSKFKGQDFLLKADNKSILISKKNIDTVNNMDSMEGTQTISIPVDKVNKLLEMIKNPNVLSIETEGKSYSVSLRGLSSVLLYMDDKQKRLNTKTALLKKGTKLFTAKSPSMPNVKLVLPTKSTNTLKIPKKVAKIILGKIESINSDEDMECYERGNKHTLKSIQADDLMILDDNNYIVQISCWLAAYNYGVSFFKVDAKSINTNLPKVEAIKFIDPTVQNKSNKSKLIDIVNGAQFSKGIIDTYMKGRGIGDCTTYQKYAWNGEVFELFEYSDMPDCRGSLKTLSIWTANLIRPQM